MNLNTWTPTPRRVAGDGSRTRWAKAQKLARRKARQLVARLQDASFEVLGALEPA